MNSIKTKIISVFILIIIVMVTIVVSIILININLLNKYKVVNENIVYEQKLKEKVPIFIEESYKAFNTGDYNNYEIQLKEIHYLEETLSKRFSAIETNPETKLSYRSLKNSLNTVLLEIENIKNTRKEEGSIAGISSSFQGSLEKFEIVKDSITSLLIVETKNIAEITTEIQNKQYFLVLSSASLLFFSIIFLLIFAFIFSKKITDPIIKLSNAAKKISDGDLSVIIDKNLIESRDEMGSLSKSFNSMVLKLRQKIIEYEFSNNELGLKINEITESNLELKNNKIVILNLLEDFDEEKDNAEKLVIERTHELKEEKARLLASINSISFGFIISDLNNEIIMKNKAIIELLGLESIGDISIDKISEIIGEDYGLKIEINKCIKEKKIHDIKEIIFGKKFFRSIIVPVLTENNIDIIGYVLMFEDITESRLIDKEKTEFVSLASHQLRTPLSAINWYTEMLLSGDAGQLNTEQIDFLEEILTSSKRMSSLVGTLLNVSRLELGTIAVSPEQKDLCQIIKDEIRDLEVQIKNKKIEIELAFNLQPAVAYIDSKIISIAIQNFLTNSIKYNTSSGKIIIGVDRNEDNGEFIISVIDTGYGIPKENQGKIFTKMYRANNAVNIDAEGNGLGLYMVKSILETSGCQISFESPPKGREDGTAFYVHIPKEGMKRVDAEKNIHDDIS